MEGLLLRHVSFSISTFLLGKMIYPSHLPCPWDTILPAWEWSVIRQEKFLIHILKQHYQNLPTPFTYLFPYCWVKVLILTTSNYLHHASVYLSVCEEVSNPLCRRWVNLPFKRISLCCCFCSVLRSFITLELFLQMYSSLALLVKLLFFPLM